MRSVAQHIVENSDGSWSLMKTGALKATKKFGTKKAARIYGIRIAKNQKTDLYIHRKDGMVEAKISYHPTASMKVEVKE